MSFPTAAEESRSGTPGNTLPPRAALAVGYAIIIVLPCILIMLVRQLPQSAVASIFLAYAFALLPTYYLDHWWLGGIGFHSLTIFALLAAVVALLLWPLPLLSANPTLWRSSRWRRVILGYGAAFVAHAICAGWRMTQSWYLFFG